MSTSLIDRALVSAFMYVSKSFESLSLTNINCTEVGSKPAIGSPICTSESKVLNSTVGIFTHVITNATRP